MSIFRVILVYISCIRTEYREILRISPYSARMRENAYQNNSEYGPFLHGGLQLSFNIFRQSSGFNKNKLYKTLVYRSRGMLNFNFPEKGTELLSPPQFVHDFSRKMFLMLHSINWPSFIVWCSLLLEILGNMCITIIC